MTSIKPYLIRAIYDWVVDNDKTPYIVIDAKVKGVQVPDEYIEEDQQIVLNISPEACRGLHLDNDKIIFTVHFSGVATQVYAPPAAVVAIYAKENGRGMVFGSDDTEEPMPPSPPISSDSQAKISSVTSTTKSKSSKPKLKIVK